MREVTTARDEALFKNFLSDEEANWRVVRHPVYDYRLVSDGRG